jgi:hypothetical protein
MILLVEGQSSQAFDQQILYGRIALRLELVAPVLYQSIGDKIGLHFLRRTG